MKTVVIGAGAAGIGSALMLARYGHQVTLLEAGAKIAPLLRGFSRAGLQFDTGFHHAGGLDPGGILRRYLNFLGLGRHLEFRPLRRDCCELYRFVVNGGTEDICLPQGLRDNVAALSARWPEHANEIGGFFERVDRAYRHSPFIDPRNMNAETLLLPQGRKLTEHLLLEGQPERLTSLLAARAVYYGTPPGRGLFEEFALVTGSMLEGVRAIDGGGASLARSFEKELAEAGVEVRRRHAAQRINTAAGAVTSVTANGEEIACAACVYTGHPRHLVSLLPAGSLRPAMARHLLTLEETSKVFMLFGATRSGFLAGRSLVLCTSDSIDRACAPTERESPWLFITPGTAGPDGEIPLVIIAKTGAGWPEDQYAGTGLSNRPPAYTDWKKEFGREILSHVLRHVPELADLRLLDASSEFSMRDWVYGGTGSGYGVLHSWDRLPVPPVTRVKGLFLAGQNILLPGLLGAFISAAVACGNIVGFSRLFKDLACASAE